MRKSLLRASLATLLLLSAAAGTLAQTTLFGSVGGGSETERGTIITIDQATAAGAFVGLGAADPTVGITGLDFDSAGRLYASTINRALVSRNPPVSTLVLLDPLTGEQAAAVGTIRLANGTPVVMTDLAVQPGTDVLFGTSLNLRTQNNSIYTIDKSTAVATLVGNTGVIGTAIAFGPDGTLYQTRAVFSANIQFVRGYLNTLDPATGAVLTTAGPFRETNVGGLAVRPTDGVIFASGGRSSDIYTLSKTGELTFVGYTGFDGVGDIAFTPLPARKSQCKSDGWRVNFPFSFKNQGDCIQFFNTGK